MSARVASRLTVAQLAPMMREAVKDKSYELEPLGQDVAEYLRVKRKRLTKDSFRDREGSLDKFVWFFADLRAEDFEPPIGTTRVEEFLDRQYGRLEPATYNKNLSYLADFFKHFRRRGRMQGDPTEVIERAKPKGVYRTTFSADQRRAIIASQDELRDKVALRLLLDYGLRKGSLKAVQFKHFDHVRKRLTIFAKGGKVRNLPLPDPALWHDLERLILDTEAEAHHYLMPRKRGNGARKVTFPDQPMGVHGMHDWWYRCLANAGIVPEGTTKGENMHKARHSAGQKLLDNTGNLKAVQMLLGHKSISTTGDIYVGWDEQQLAASLLDSLKREEEGQ